MMQKQIKVLFISFSSLLQKFYHSLPREIVEQSGWEVKVLAAPYRSKVSGSGRNFLEKAYGENYDIIVGDTALTGQIHTTFFRSHLAELIKIFQPDVIDLEAEPVSLCSLQTVLSAQRFSRNSKIILHAFAHRPRTYPLPFNFIEKYVLKKIDAIWTRHRLSEEAFRKKGFSGACYQFIPGVNPEVFFPRNLPELRHQINPDEKILIGFVGPVEKHKGLQHLITAARSLPCKLLLIGEGRYQVQLMRMAAVNKVEAQFISHATHEEIAQYMNIMDIFILPSLTRFNWIEKYGRIVIEAMASGTPVIVSNSGNLPSFIGDAGLVFEEGNSDALRAAIIKYINNERMRSEYGWKGRKRAMSHFSWKKVAARYIDVYSELIKTKMPVNIRAF